MTDRTPEAALAAATLAMTVVKNEANDSHSWFGTWTVDQGAERFLEVMRNKGWVLTPVTPEVPPPGLREALLTAEPIIRGMMDALAARMPFFHALLDEHPDRFVPALVDAALAAIRTPEPPDPLTFSEEYRRGWYARGTDPHSTAFDRAEPPDSGDGAELDDNPEFDGTDAAHPAWWRGSDHATKMLRARDAGVDAALLAEALQATPHGSHWSQPSGALRHETTVPWANIPAREQSRLIAEAQAVLEAAARLRSGSPAPEGGE